MPVQPSPDAPWQGSLSSFFSSLASRFASASVGAPKPDTADDAAPKRRHRAYAKLALVSKPDHQASSRSFNRSAGQPRSVSLSQAERDALFREFLRWKESQ